MTEPHQTPGLANFCNDVRLQVADMLKQYLDSHCHSNFDAIFAHEFIASELLAAAQIRYTKGRHSQKRGRALRSVGEIAVLLSTRDFRQWED